MHILIVDPQPASRDYIIKRWHEQGHRISTLGRAPSDDVRRMVSEHQDSRLADRSHVLAAAHHLNRSARIDAVVAYGQAAMTQANWVAHALSLPHLWDDPDLDLRDKATVARLWADANVPQPHTIEVTEPNDPRLDAITGPVVVKPSGMMGALGVRRCENPAEVRQWVRHLLDPATWTDAGPRAAQLHTNYGISQSCLVQSLLQADPVGDRRPEFTAECVVNDGQVHLIGSFQKYHSRPPFFEERNLFAPPTDLSSAQLTMVRALAQKAIGALGFRWGVCHLELCFQDGQPYLFEINPRLVGESNAKVLSALTETHSADLLLSPATGQHIAPRMRQGMCGASVFVCAGEPFRGRTFLGLNAHATDSIEEWIDYNRPIGYVIKPPGIRPSQILARIGIVATSPGLLASRMTYWLSPTRIRV